MSTRLLLTTIAALLFGSIAHADDWPQFRGPNRDGLSKEKGLLKEWPKGGLKPVWSFTNAGLGFSSMSIADGKLYTLGTRGDDEVVLCLDAIKGNELWTAKIGPIFTFQGNSWGDGPRGTPTINGTGLYAIGGQGILVCLDISAAKPKELWRKDLIKDLGGVMMDSSGSWGYCESPLVDGKFVICSPGGKQGTVAALDKMTGGLVWRSTELKHDAAYTSAVAADIQGVRQYIQASFAGDKEGGFLSGISAADGKVLWSQKTVPGAIFSIAAAPLVKGNLVYQTTYAGGCHLFEIGKDMKPKELYSQDNQKTLTNNHGGVIRIGDHVYGRGHNDWICQEFKTGAEAATSADLLGHKSATLIGADGMLYLYTDRGEVGLADANPKEFNLVSDFKIPQRSKYLPKGSEPRGTSRSSGAWAYPVIANGRLYLRDGELIFCYDIRGRQ